MYVTVREAVREDCYQIFKLSRDLIAFENFPESSVTVDDMMKAGGFEDDKSPKLFHSYVATLADSDDISGYISFSFTFTAMDGKVIWLDNLYVKPECRGKGIAKKLLQRLAHRAIEDNCAGVDFSVMEWNSSAIDMYKRYGADHFHDEQLFGFDRDALVKLVNQ
ncbi:Thialysine N-epsilon-acetyltransferase [Halotydeus destructor]|nr:Thialysine N-epsilon-acetyltransferase [Halotydeus destructor]